MTSELTPVGCIAMLDRPLPRHGARAAASGSRLQAVSNARHHPRPYSTFMRGFVVGRRVHAVVRFRRESKEMAELIYISRNLDESPPTWRTSEATGGSENSPPKRVTRSSKLPSIPEYK